MVNLLCEHSELFSETWPTSGMMLDGKVYALPTQAHLTTDSEFSSLPTPSAAQEPGFTTQPVDKNGNPTSNPNERWYHPETGRLMQKGITQALNAVLPTPIVRDYKDGSSDVLRDGEVQTDTLARAVFSSGEVSGISWGKFEPAIRRWESILGRPAPAPTKPDGKDGAHRLSSEFTEWMMGVPAGWITGVGLSRNDELKACGNGVVPQQAELALRMLLEGVDSMTDELPVLPTVMANSPMRNSRRAMVTHPTKRSSVALNQAIELMQGKLPSEFESWDEVPDGYKDAGGGLTMLPTPTVSDTFTDNLKSTQQKEGSMHSVTLPQAVKGIDLKATTPARTQAGAV